MTAYMILWVAVQAASQTGIPQTPLPWTLRPNNQAPPIAQPIAPGYCPPGTLPQYCAVQTGTGPKVPGVPPPLLPYNCPLGNVQCLQQHQSKMAMGCAPGPFQLACLQKAGRPGPIILGNPYASNPLQQPRKKDGLQKIMPILNALSQMMGGGAPEPAYPGGERMAGVDGHGHGGAYGYPGSANATAAGLNGTARVEAPFKEYFPRCTRAVGLGECSFKHLGTFGDASHRARYSCHNSGDAIDVGFPFTCGGRTIQSTDPEAMAVAKCMAGNADNRFKVIFQDRTDPDVPNLIPGGKRGQHNGHMHIQLNPCRSVMG